MDESQNLTLWDCLLFVFVAFTCTGFETVSWTLLSFFYSEEGNIKIVWGSEIIGKYEKDVTRTLKFCSMQLHSFYSAPNAVRVATSGGGGGWRNQNNKKLVWENEYTQFLRRKNWTEESTRHRRRGEDNITFHVREIVCEVMNYIHFLRVV
jgi:hypothetical protein